MDEVKVKKRGKKTVENNKVSFLSGKETDAAGTSVSDYFRNELGQFTEGNTGQLKRYETKEALQEAIIRYFEFCQQNAQHLTMSGLAIALGFKTRQALVFYEKEEGYEFAHDIISYAKMRIQEATEQKLHDPRASIIGAIFSLKNNFGWADKSEIKMDQRTMAFNGFEIDLTDDNESNTIPIK